MTYQYDPEDVRYLHLDAIRDAIKVIEEVLKINCDNDGAEIKTKADIRRYCLENSDTYYALAWIGLEDSIRASEGRKLIYHECKQLKETQP